jgi:hypothetical protein
LSVNTTLPSTFTSTFGSAVPFSSVILPLIFFASSGLLDEEDLGHPVIVNTQIKIHVM